MWCHANIVHGMSWMLGVLRYRRRLPEFRYIYPAVEDRNRLISHICLVTNSH